MIVLLVRHGHSVSNEQNIYQGISIDDELSNQGKQEAKDVYTWCVNHHFTPRRIISSPLKRAQQTATIIYEEFNDNNIVFEINESFKEINLGYLEGLTKTKAQIEYPEELRQLKATNYDFSCLHGEEKLQVEQRVNEVITYLQSIGEEMVLVVSHGAFIREMLQMILKDSYKRIKISNGQVIPITVRKGDFTND